MYQQAKSWPFQEARSLLQHITRKGKKPGDVVTFQTGYGPSGAPHIGTFGEVIRTLWVMRAFNELTNQTYQTRLIMFSDDFDAMRKVPDGLPEWMNAHLGCPLSQVPNPYGTLESSFAEANNMKLVDFVDGMLRIYDGSTVGSSPDRSRLSFVSSAERYRAGDFNEQLMKVWSNYQAVQDIMLPSLGVDRQATYSAFMPIVDRQGMKVLDQAQVVCDPSFGPGYIRFDNQGVPTWCKVEHGLVKLQWKVDWAMRWLHFDVDYEMSGKDLIESVRLSSKICRVLGGTPPLNMTYELFLDENGEKISKTKGNGFSIDQWLQYGSFESLCWFMFQNPKAAKKLYMGLIPGMEDELIKSRRKDLLNPDDPYWHIRGPLETVVLNSDISYQLLLNLAQVTQAKDTDALLAYLEQDRPISTVDRPFVEELAGKALRYASDQGLLRRILRAPTDRERQAFNLLADKLEGMDPSLGGEAFQYEVYEVGKLFGFDPLRSWFQSLYECFFGASEGPRFGHFTAAYGLRNTVDMLRSV